MTAKIDYNKIANALISYFDSEITVIICLNFTNALNHREHQIFTEIMNIMKNRDVEMTTKETREIKRQREEINCLCD